MHVTSLILALRKWFCKVSADAELVISFNSKQNKIQCNALSYLGLILLGVQKVGIIQTPDLNEHLPYFLVAISAL